MLPASLCRYVDDDDAAAHTEQHDSEGEPTAIDNEETLPTNQQSPRGPQPREASLHSRTLSKVILARDDWTAPLGTPGGRTALGWNAHADAPPPQGLAKPGAII